MLLILALVSFASTQASLNIKSRIVGDGQHGTARWANREISELTEQNIIINQLCAKGYMDDMLFTQQKDEIGGKLDELRTRRRNLLKQDDDDPTLAGIQSLYEFMESAEPLANFDEVVFAAIVDKIIIDNKRLRFRLIGGLELFNT